MKSVTRSIGCGIVNPLWGAPPPHSRYWPWECRIVSRPLYRLAAAANLTLVQRWVGEVLAAPAGSNRGRLAGASVYRHCPSQVSWPSCLMASYASVRVAKVPTIAPSFHWSTTATLHFFIGLHRRLTNSPMPRAPNSPLDHPSRDYSYLSRISSAKPTAAHDV